MGPKANDQARRTGGKYENGYRRCADLPRLGRKPPQPRQKQPAHQRLDGERADPRPAAKAPRTPKAFCGALHGDQNHPDQHPNGTGAVGPRGGPFTLYKRRTCMRSAAQGARYPCQRTEQTADTRHVGQPPRRGGHGRRHQQSRRQALRAIGRGQRHPAAGRLRASGSERAHRRPVGVPCSKSRSSRGAPSAARRHRTARCPGYRRCQAPGHTRTRFRGSW
jgi:hypothetical protein